MTSHLCILTTVDLVDLWSDHPLATSIYPLWVSTLRTAQLMLSKCLYWFLAHQAHPLWENRPCHWLPNFSGHAGVFRLYRIPTAILPALCWLNIGKRKGKTYTIRTQKIKRKTKFNLTGLKSEEDIHVLTFDHIQQIIHSWTSSYPFCGFKSKRK